jgi:hypothetical protein
LQAGGHRFDPGQLHQITKEFCSQAENICPMLGATCDAAIFAVTMKSLMSAEHWTGQASNQRSTPSYVERWLQGESRKVKPETMISP